MRISFPSPLILGFSLMFISASAFAQTGLQYPEDDSAVKVAEVMPVLLSCEDTVEPEKRQSCTNDGIMTHIMNELVYPEEAQNKGLEGTVVVEFVVSVKGLVSDVKILRGLGPLDAAALDVVRSLPNFTPGLENGKPVNVKYALPIRFSLSE
jgi:TonB family protein